MKLSNFISMLVPFFVFGVALGAVWNLLSHLFTSCAQGLLTTCSSLSVLEILNYLDF